MNAIENRVAKIEQLINPLDWVPIVSSFSGMVRILAGEIQILAGAIFAAMKILSIMLTAKGNYWQAIGQGLNYSIHGAGNMVRGAIAMLPPLNMTLFIYDNYIGRMNYLREKMSPNVYPIMTAYLFA